MARAADRLRKLASDKRLSVSDQKFALYMDSVDPLATMRSEFEMPKKNAVKNFCGKDGEAPCIYFNGNSLGLQPKRIRQCITEQLDKWAGVGIDGHFREPLPWYSIGEDAADKILPIVGAVSRQEVAIMSSLTVNLHLLLVSFYRPTAARHKIVIEGGAFPSDRYAASSQIKFHGFNPKESLVQLQPRPGEEILRTEDIVAFLEAEGSSVCVLLLSGVQFFTGQLFDMATLTKAAHKHGCYAGFDLAHAIGNVPLALHDWDVDFACWCSYKYLNSGPGGVGGLFMHERHAKDSSLPRFSGWWGNDPSTRFQMSEEFEPLPGAGSFQLSNVPMLLTASLISSLGVFDMTSLEKLREKSLLLTGYLELLIGNYLDSIAVTDDGVGEPKAKRAAVPLIQIITPADESQRGCQLSFRFPVDVQLVHSAFQKHGVVVDMRKPDVIRVAPVPLYNTFADVHTFVDLLKDILGKIVAEKSSH